MYSFFSEICSETLHDAVHVETKDGGDWVTRPMTFFVKAPKPTIERWLRLQQSRGMLQQLSTGTTKIIVSWYWDKAARTIAGYPISALMISFPQLFKRPGSTHSVFPLVVHAGGIPSYQPDTPAKEATAKRKAVKAKRGKPPVRESLNTTCAEALNSLRTITVPTECLSPELQLLGDIEQLELPIELLNISDQAAISETCPDVAAGNSIQFPAKFSDPSKTKFNNGMSTRPSAECTCTSAQMAYPGTACATGPRRALRFFISPTVVPVTCRRAYMRHSLVHGHPAIAADIACFLYRCGLRQIAELICHMLPAPYDPLCHLREGPKERPRPIGGGVEFPPGALDPGAAGGGDQKKASTNSERPIWAVRLSFVTDQLHELSAGHRCRVVRQPGGRYMTNGRPTLLNILDVLREDNTSFPLPRAGLSASARPDPRAASPAMYTVAQHFQDAITYALWCFRPEATGVPDPSTIANLGRDVLVRHKALLEASVPWCAPPPDTPNPPGWWGRLLRDQPSQAESMSRVRFCVNATSFAQSLHEFLLGGSTAIRLYGKSLAARIHEEAFERIFLYWWLITFVMGGLLACREARLRFSVMLFFCAVFAGCPSMMRVSSAEFRHRAYQGKRRLRRNQPAEVDVTELFGIAPDVALPDNDASPCDPPTGDQVPKPWQFEDIT